MDKRKLPIDRICTVIYVIVLIAYPLLKVNQGLYVGDTTYSPANFAFHGSMHGTWTVATYLANALGSILMKLPGGATLLGLNIWTSLIVSLTAILPLILLNRDISIHMLFAGGMLALGLCWCPTTILYNYLTYLLFTAGALLLYRGICDDKWLYFAAAGLVLGINVFTRLPNVTETALILVLWFAGWISHKPVRDVIRQTLTCIAGYAAGFIVLWIIVSARYGISAYPDMIHNMFAMTDKAVDYKPTAMITAMFEDYLYAGLWIALWLAGAILCALIYHLVSARSGRTAEAGSDSGNESEPNSDAERVRRAPVIICAISAVAVFAVVIRLCYGRGMFSFNYYEYRAVYFWAVILLFFTTVMALYVICRRNPIWSDDEAYRRKRILSLTMLIMIYVTCIGSNNGLYPIVNNMFITAPYILWMVCDMVRGLILSDRDMGTAGDTGASEDKSPIGHLTGACIYAMLVLTGVLYLGTFIQSVGFHFGYSFNDGIYGEARDAYVTGYERTAGIRTTQANAQALQGLMDHIYAHKSEGDSVILYGEIPGLGYILDMPSALTTFWPDLDSYNYAEWSADLETAEPAYIIVSLPAAAWMSADPEAISYFGDDALAYDSDPKIADLASYISEHGFVQDYANDAYVVYVHAD